MTTEHDTLTEESILESTNKIIIEQNIEQLSALFIAINEYLFEIPKPKSSRIVKKMAQSSMKINNAVERIDFLLKCVDFSIEQKRKYSTLKLKTFLAETYHEAKQYPKAIELTEEILRAFRKSEDFLSLVQTYLLQSEIYLSIGDALKAKSSLVAAKANSNKVDLTAHLSGRLNLQNGLINLETSEYTTAYSYFLEGFEAFASLAKTKSDYYLMAYCSMFMVLSKFLSRKAFNFERIISKSLLLKFQEFSEILDEFQLLTDLNKIVGTKNLRKFQLFLDNHEGQFSHPYFVKFLQNLKQTMIEENVLKVIRPYSKVELDFLAKRVGIDENRIVKIMEKLVISDKLDCLLDQADGILFINSRDRSVELLEGDKKEEEEIGRDSLFIRSTTVQKDSKTIPSRVADQMKSLDTVVDSMFEVVHGKLLSQ
eukprot:TRINITY_DN2865_c0_g1_i1.p1 TRINITY_DN2865_c0_g1~~TRINITY_DN2865_c0_g1_i1.p1  ORF type:complete len:436 (+),score=116.85 TRINITY_DN2865_c0_g1_i1:33-1310(+)